MLGSSGSPLCSAYDLAMVDLDGVVYIGGDAVRGAPEHLASVRRGGMRVAFVTNNAARTPERVAAHLRALGIEAATDDVVTSAQAASRVLAERLGPGARVVLLGGSGLEQALRAESLEPIGVEDAGAQAVVTGYGPDVAWRDIMRAAVLVREGLWWVATNSDYTIPTPYGLAPGHGVLVDTIRRFAQVEPLVAGKPQRPLLDETVRRMGGKRPLMVGDRLDTDIEGARNAGLDSLLVLTGVTGLAELVAAVPAQRPTYVSGDLGGLEESHQAPQERDGSFASGGWTAGVDSGRLTVAGLGRASTWWQVVAATAWRHLDESGQPADVRHLRVPPP